MEVIKPQNAFIVLYRWRLIEGSEQSFTQAWTTITEILKTRGSLGSRLHKSSDGLWYGYAQWPSATARELAFATPIENFAASHAMNKAISERFPEILLEPMADLLDPLDRNSK